MTPFLINVFLRKGNACIKKVKEIFYATIEAVSVMLTLKKFKISGQVPISPWVH